MATKAEINAVYAAALIQGVALVTFPAASTIFTDPSQYDLSNTQYGTMFLPQVVTAVTSSLLGGRLAQRYGTTACSALSSAAAVSASRLTPASYTPSGGRAAHRSAVCDFLVGELLASDTDRP